MAKSHNYEVTVTWTGNLGSGTSGYRDFSRSHNVEAVGVPMLLGSADPSFRGDAERWNPEQLLLAAVSQCHMLTYFHLAARSGIVVTDYVDGATAVMETSSDGSGQFASATLNPRVTITDGSTSELAAELHDKVGDYCFIARSVSFPIHHNVTTRY